jgi:hypothetical protein
VKQKAAKYWEIIADNLKKAGFSVGWVSVLDNEDRTIWIADAHRNGRRFIVRADDKLTAFLELERQALTVTFYLESINDGFKRLINECGSGSDHFRNGGKCFEAPGVEPIFSRQEDHDRNLGRYKNGIQAGINPRKTSANV